MYRFKAKRIDNGEEVKGGIYPKRVLNNRTNKSYYYMFNLDYDLIAVANFIKNPEEYSHLKESIFEVDPSTVELIGENDEISRKNDDIKQLEDLINRQDKQISKLKQDNKEILNEKEIKIKAVREFWEKMADNDFNDCCNFKTEEIIDELLKDKAEKLIKEIEGGSE